MVIFFNKYIVYVIFESCFVNGLLILRGVASENFQTIIFIWWSLLRKKKFKDKHIDNIFTLITHPANQSNYILRYPCHEGFWVKVWGSDCNLFLCNLLHAPSNFCTYFCWMNQWGNGSINLFKWTCVNTVQKYLKSWGITDMLPGTLLISKCMNGIMITWYFKEWLFYLSLLF